VENDRREDQQPTPPLPETSHREEAPREEWHGGSGEAHRDADDNGGYREPYRDPEPGSGREGQPPHESSQPPEGGAPGEQGSPQQGGGGQMGAGGGRNRRRGGRGRLSPRDRRMQARNRGRDRDRDRPPFNRPPGGGSQPPQQGGDEREEQRYSDLPPEQRTLILQAKAEVERIRETLEGVLRDLEDVSEQLTRAEHEKDVAEAEIEQLRDSLRRLHR